MRLRPSGALSGSLDGVLVAGQRLQEALKAEHALSAGLENRRGEPGLYDRFREARERTRLASSAYDEAIQNCAAAPVGQVPPEAPARIWARIAALASRPGGSKAASNFAAAVSRH